MTASTVIAAGQSIIGTLSCPNGKRAVGGGWTTADSNPGVNVTGSGPTADGGAWTGGMYNGSAASTTLTLSVTCITVPQAGRSLARRADDAPVFEVVRVSAGT